MDISCTGKGKTSDVVCRLRYLLGFCMSGRRAINCFGHFLYTSLPHIIIFSSDSSRKVKAPISTKSLRPPSWNFYFTTDGVLALRHALGERRLPKQGDERVRRRVIRDGQGYWQGDLQRHILGAPDQRILTISSHMLLFI